MLRLLITRSSGSLRKLSVSGVTSEETMSFIADHAQSLHTLRIPRSEINDPILGKSASLLSKITYLDLSYCTNLGAPALEAIGRNCKSLTTLLRVMHRDDIFNWDSQDEEALAIAPALEAWSKLWPRLEHLEIAYLLVSTSSVMEIINNCKNLELLDVRGCWAVNLEEDFVKGFPKLKVVGPDVMVCYEDIGWDDHSDNGGYLGWDDSSESDEYFDDMWDAYLIEDDPLGDVLMEICHPADHIYW